MAYLEKRGARWRALVRIKGQSASKTFRTKAEAQAWAAEKEAQFAAGRELPRGKTVSDLIDRYLEERTVLRETRLRLRRTQARALGDVRLSDLDAPHIASWRDERLKEVSVASVLREWNDLSALFTCAIKEWRWLEKNPTRDVLRPKKPKPRKRRPVGEELEDIVYMLGYRAGKMCQSASARVAAAALFAVETAMRRSEIASLRPENFHGTVAHLTKTKNGDERTVPLSTRARQILKQLPDGHFNLTPGTITTVWARGRVAAGVTGLRFHDLRREGTTRLSKKVDVMTLAKITGHRDLTILLNTYYAPDMADVSELLD